MDEKREHVVVKDGQRQSGLLTQEEAQRVAQQEQQKLNERAGEKNEGRVQVKQNLFG
jgi:hypothetical protein